MSKQILLSLLNCSWQWMLLSGLIWFVASSRFRKSRHSKTTVHLLWLLSLLSLPILFGLNQFMPAPSIGGTAPELAQAKPVNVSGLDALTADLPEISSGEGDTQSNNRLFAGGKFFFNWIKTDLLLWGWAIGALAMLARFMFGLYRIYQLRRSAVAADDSYQTICQRFSQQLDIKHPVTVCFSDRVASPISFGWLSPHILIPRNLNLEQFELVAAHELAHVQRLDWLTNLFSHVVGVIFFFHPIYHFLNRELVHLRERICDDWVIQLTGDRKNYAQCLLDLVRHRDRAIPLALSLNQPSQLESRIDAILKSNRQLDVQLKPRLRLMVATLLLTCLPLLAMAQLMPLKTFQVSLFAQTPEKLEEAVEKTAEKQDMQKAKAEKMGKKEYKDNSYIKVKDPTLFERPEENRIFSGPQPGEKLPPLNATSIVGASEDKTFDFIAKSDEHPLVLFLQDGNGAGLRGLYDISRMIAKITNESKQKLHVSIVFLGNDPDALKQRVSGVARDVAESVSKNVLLGISSEGREGPGSYGLNRNVSQTILIAKDGKVLHNFAFTQPTVYAYPHVLGAIAHVLGTDPAAVEEWLNEEPADEERMQRDRQRMERKGARNSEQDPSREELAKRLDKEDSDFEISLADAIRNGDIEAIKQHIADGVDVNELFFETPPLAWAALMGQTEAAALLLQHGADINGKNKDGNTALHLAVFLGRAETAELLLKNEADVNAKNYDSLTSVDFLRIPWEITKSTLRYLDVELKQEQLEAGKSEIWEMFRADAKRSAKPNTQDAPTNLWTAASVGDVQAIKRYIKEGGDVNALDREFHLPAMSWGALHGQTEVVRFLIKSGADVNRKSEDDNTPLHSAAFFGRTDIAKLLLKHGADIKARNDDGATPADALYVDWQTTAFIGDLVGVEIGKAEISAMKRGRFEVAKLFGVEETYAAQNLLEAAFISDLAAVKQALTDGGNPSARDLESGTTVLATAALMGHTKAVAMLLEHGADVNAKNPDGSTALHAAAFLGRAETVWLLLEKGADATIRNNDGATPLDVTKADWEITEYVAEQLQIEIDEAEINIRRSEVVKLISQHNRK